MSHERRQIEFCDGIWHTLEQSESITIVPIQGYRPPDGNRRERRPVSRTFSPIPLTIFEELPFAEEYRQRFQKPPMAVLRLGRKALLAMSFRSEMSSIPNIDIHVEERIYSHLVNLEYDRMRELRQVNLGRPYRFGRNELVSVSGGRYVHEDVSGRHTEVITGVSDVTIVDLGSLVSTLVAVESGAENSNGVPHLKSARPSEDLRTDDHLRLWEQEFAKEFRELGGLQALGPV